jgi:hypothetical protein
VSKNSGDREEGAMFQAVGDPCASCGGEEVSVAGEGENRAMSLGSGSLCLYNELIMRPCAHSTWVAP